MSQYHLAVAMVSGLPIVDPIGVCDEIIDNLISAGIYPLTARWYDFIITELASNIC